MPTEKIGLKSGVFEVKLTVKISIKEVKVFFIPVLQQIFFTSFVVP
jgi:hypothetical protein